MPRRMIRAAHIVAYQNGGHRHLRDGVVVWDAQSLFMTPVRDPIRNIVYSAQAEDLDSVLIDGAWIMRDRAIAGLDPSQLAGDVQRAAEQMWAGISAGDWAGRDIDRLSPQSFPPFST